MTYGIRNYVTVTIPGPPPIGNQLAGKKRKLKRLRRKTWRWGLCRPPWEIDTEKEAKLMAEAIMKDLEGAERNRERCFACDGDGCSTCNDFGWMFAGGEPPTQCRMKATGIACGLLVVCDECPSEPLLENGRAPPGAPIGWRPE